MDYKKLFDLTGKVCVVTGGTDLHHRDHEGSLFTCFAEMPQNEKDLVRLLRSGDYVFMTADKIIIP